MRRGMAATAAGLLVVAFPAAPAAAQPSAPDSALSSSKLSPDLAARLAAAGPDDSESVIVVLADQVDVSSVTGRTRAARLRKVVRTLRSHSLTTQGPIRSILAARSAGGSVTKVTPLWIQNAIAVTATPRVVEQLASRPDVASVTSDQVDIVPATGPAEPNQQAIGAPAMWDLGHTGAGVVVATLDSGVDMTNPDLAESWRGGDNSWYDPYGQHPATPTDLSGHGTATMGVMVGGDAGGTSIGTAPGATWIAARIFDDRGGATATALHQAFQWLLDPDHDPATNDAPRVVNGSWSIGAGPSCDLSFQPDVQALRAAGILPVFSAGNYGSSASTSTSPANYPESLAVGAVSGSDLVYPASSRGPSTCGGRSGLFPDLVAPGVEIVTADRYGFYQTVSGTSLSAPHVAGALALLLDARPGLTPDQQYAALAAGAVDLGDPGPDSTYGLGRIDVVAAYASLVPEPDTVGPQTADVAVAPATVDRSNASDVAVTATADDSASGGSDIAAAEYFVDNEGDAGAGVAMTVEPAGPMASLQATIPAAAVLALPDGAHPVFVHARDAAGNWGPTASTTLTVTTTVTDALTFSTFGNANPPTVGGAADDADLYRWSGTAYSRLFDASANGLPAAANVDGLDMVDATHFYLSFAAATTAVPGLGNVQDEDVVYYNNGSWSVYFDGTAHGLTTANEDVDAISVAGTTLYFSTLGNTSPPGVGGAADDADIYSWNGASYSRVFDASANGLPAAANVDGYVRTAANDFYLSFSAATTAVPGQGNVQDEDVVHYRAGAWSVYFDGTAHGLKKAAQDVDAFDIGPP